MKDTNITVFDNLMALNLNVSIWTARKKLTPADFSVRNCRRRSLLRLAARRFAIPRNCASSAPSRLAPLTSWTGPASAFSAAGASLKIWPTT